MRMLRYILIPVTTLLLPFVSAAVEPDQYRLLSITPSIKLILISHATTKAKLLLDASTAKITVDGKPAEFDELNFYTVIQVKFDKRRFEKEGINLDGVVREINIRTPDNPARKPPETGKSPSPDSPLPL